MVEDGEDNRVHGCWAVVEDPHRWVMATSVVVIMCGGHEGVDDAGAGQVIDGGGLGRVHRCICARDAYALNGGALPYGVKIMPAVASGSGQSGMPIV